MMKNYIRQVIELFSQNDYPISVQKLLILFGRKPVRRKFPKE